MKTGCSLIDGEESNRLHPLTFEIPSLEDRLGIAPGSYVKIGVNLPDSKIAERFWVLVETNDGQTITGKVSNDLVYVEDHGLDDTDEVTFEPRHILSLD